jgi:hypothetical protein
MAQFLRPNAVISGGFTAVGETNPWDCANEVSADDSKYYYISGGGAQAYMGLSTATDPVVHTGHILRIRLQRPAGNRCSVQLRCGAGEVRWVIDWDYAQTSWYTHVLTLTEAQAAAITNYSAVSIRYYLNSGDNELDTSWVELEIPDAPAVTVNLQAGSISSISPSFVTLMGTVGINLNFGAMTLSGPDLNAVMGAVIISLNAGTITFDELPLEVKNLLSKNYSISSTVIGLGGIGLRPK